MSMFAKTPMALRPAVLGLRAPLAALSKPTVFQPFVVRPATIALCSTRNFSAFSAKSRRVDATTQKELGLPNRHPLARPFFKLETLDKMYHVTPIAMGVLLPAALVLSPSVANFPVDLALGVVLPVHFHWGWNATITDYCPRGWPEQTLRAIMWITTGMTIAGLLKLNLYGDGITETLKSLWRKKRSQTKRWGAEDERKAILAANSEQAVAPATLTGAAVAAARNAAKGDVLHDAAEKHPDPSSVLAAHKDAKTHVQPVDTPAVKVLTSPATELVKKPAASKADK